MLAVFQCSSAPATHVDLLLLGWLQVGEARLGFLDLRTTGFGLQGLKPRVSEADVALGDEEGITNLDDPILVDVGLPE